MARLEDLTPSATVRGVLPNCVVSVISAQWFGSEALELTFKDPIGRVGNELLYRHDEQRFEAVKEGRFDPFFTKVNSELSDKRFPRRLGRQSHCLGADQFPHVDDFRTCLLRD
jgi:hypothetical protein